MRTIRPLSEIKEDYNFLMGYTIGKPREWYCGIDGITYIFMGSWNDPLIGYKGYAFNEPWFTDGLFCEYEEETGNSRWEGYTAWMKVNGDLLKENLDCALDAYLRRDVV